MRVDNNPTETDDEGNTYVRIEYHNTGEVHKFRQDGDVDIPMEFDEEDMRRLTELAEKNNCTINEVIVSALQAAIDRAEQEETDLKS